MSGAGRASAPGDRAPSRSRVRVNGSVFPGLPTRQLPAWRVRLVKSFRRLGQRLRWWLRIRRGTLVGGVWYKETSAIPLSRALRPPPEGPGFKEYRVTFSDGEKLVVRCTNTDVLADLMGSVGLEHYYKLAPIVRPGMRVLEIGAGSGYRAAWLSQMVGPSGAVVAIGSSRPLVEFAAKRYARPNIAFEVGSAQTLAGEIEGSFDLVFVSGVVDLGEESLRLLSELWRVLRTGGVLIAHLSCPTDGPQTADTPSDRGPAELERQTLSERKPPEEVRALEAVLSRWLAASASAAAAHQAEAAAGAGSRSDDTPPAPHGESISHPPHRTAKARVQLVSQPSANVWMIAAEKPDVYI